MKPAAWAMLALVTFVGQTLAEEQPPIPRERPTTSEAPRIFGSFTVPSSDPSIIVLDGRIEQGATFDFHQALKAQPSATTLVVASNGGFFPAALSIAEEVRARGLSTVIPSGRTCQSACAYVFLAGVDRSIEGGGSLGVHQIEGPTTPTEAQQALSGVFEALRRFGVRDGVISAMLKTGPTEMHVFSPTEVAALGIETPTSTAGTVADRLASDPTGNTTAPAETTTPAAELMVQELLVSEPAAAPAALPLVEPESSQPEVALDPVSLAGTQSLLLEASDSGTTGAVPYSGTVEWTQGTDEMGLPTLAGRALIPARNLSVDVLVRKNPVSSLQASHLVHVRFGTPDNFSGGAIAGLPGVLLKNEELVQGTPLNGISTRERGNEFLFALDPKPDSLAANVDLLTSRKWMDLALIYATGKRAIVTLEMDDAAQTTAAAVANIQAYVQLSAQPTLAEAEVSLAATREQANPLLSGAALRVIPVNLGTRGRWFRVGIETASFVEAVALCRSLKATAIDCVPLGATPR